MLFLLVSSSSARAEDAKQRLFERVFGDAVRLDPAMVEKVKAAKPGERVLVDRNGDGKNDEAWFIDTSTRHTEQAKPILVRAIDEDGDLDANLGPDLDSDLYVADWKADGTVDAVLDYQDNDGDNDVDEMAFYFYMPHHAYFGDDVLRVWWSADDGDDNLLWYDVNYTYYQDLCQYRCHFSGDESFVAFGLTLGRDQWTSAYENPFLFYDPDGDTCGEVVLRIEGHDDQVRAVRYSFDADDDAFGERTHDYDFSITTRAPKENPVRLSGSIVKGMKLRGIPTQAWLQREHACRFVENAPWQVAVLTWDEINANTEQNVDADPHERWEGVIAHASEHFEQVGGPPCSPLNKRNEVALKPVAPMKLYYAMADRRLHLKGASKGWLDVDYDFDGKRDARYEYRDDNSDGIFERRLLDLDSDGQVDFDWKVQHASQRELDLEFEAVSKFYKSELEQTLAESQAFIDTAKAALGPGNYPDAEAVESFFLTKLSAWMPETRLGEYMRKSPAGTRFYMDLVRDRLLFAIVRHFGEQTELKPLVTAYGMGNYRQATADVARLVPQDGDTALVPEARARRFGSYNSRVPIVIGNTERRRRVDWPVSIPLSDIEARTGKLALDQIAIVAPDRWIDWRQVPHQIDEIDPQIGKQISFLVNAPENGRLEYHLYYEPEALGNVPFECKTGTAQDWVPPNIGWESNRVAYRAYWGQFDFFGKKTDKLIYDNIGAASYHEETEWGIDALHVGRASGIGGLTLYDGENAWLVQNPAGEGKVQFKKRILEECRVFAAIEIAASNIVPDKPDLTVTVTCAVYAERQESEIRVRVTGASQDMMLAPGLVKLPRERFFADAKTGCFGSWGWQQDVIGEIGMGLIVSPTAVVDVVELPDEHRVRCRLSEQGELRYWIIGDWRRGRQHPVAPTIDNWRRELTELARGLLKDVSVEVGRPEYLR